MVGIQNGRDEIAGSFEVEVIDVMHLIVVPKSSISVPSDFLIPGQVVHGIDVDHQIIRSLENPIGAPSISASLRNARQKLQPACSDSKLERMA